VLSAGQENALKLWYYDDTANKWIDMIAYTDRANNVIFGVSIAHPSFSLLS
jgi:hypothetical protein